MVALSENNQVIGSQLGLYDQLGRSATPVDPVEIGAIVGFGLHLYHTIHRLDALWSESVHRTSMAPRIDDAQELGRLYQRWLDASHRVLAMLVQSDESGQGIIGAAEFREAFTEVSSLLSIPLERLYEPATNLKTSVEVRDALRRRLQQRS